MRSLASAATPGVAAGTRVVLLPGAYHGPQDFLDAGFAARVAERRLDIDLSFVDLELQHLGDRSALQRLKLDIVSPARAQGCVVWLAGISLGGLFALDYAATFPGELHGLCLLAPYLGNRMLVAEIARTGLADWQDRDLDRADAERRIWHFIKTRRGPAPALYLGYGREDRFAKAHALMAAAMPATDVDVVPGGHEWSTWCRLWENFLDSKFT
jgi:pimeloyl-ACP methyl ester carboxylesterase